MTITLGPASMVAIGALLLLVAEMGLVLVAALWVAAGKRRGS